MTLAVVLPVAFATIMVVDMSVSRGRPAKTMAGAVFWLGMSAVAAGYLFWSFFFR